MLCHLQNRPNWGLFIVRITLGAIFIAHGSQKVLGLFGGPGLEGFAQWSATMGISTPLAYLGACAELLGGILLLTGIAAELGALLVIGVMLGAVWFVHWSHGFFVQDGGFEYPLSLIFFALAILVGGPGKHALWPHWCHLLGCNCKKQ
jgi:putative oxidoreductase